MAEKNSFLRFSKYNLVYFAYLWYSKEELWDAKSGVPQQGNQVRIEQHYAVAMRG